MTRGDEPAERPADEDAELDPAQLDPAQFDSESSDVGGPASALGTGVESSLTGGADVESGDEGRASSSPRPSGD